MSIRSGSAGALTLMPAPMALGDATWFLQVCVPEPGLVVRSVKMSATGEVIDGVVFDGIALAAT